MCEKCTLRDNYNRRERQGRREKERGRGGERESDREGGRMGDVINQSIRFNDDKVCFFKFGSQSMRQLLLFRLPHEIYIYTQPLKKNKLLDEMQPLKKKKRFNVTSEKKAFKKQK